jgi:hypothetical protein
MLSATAQILYLSTQTKLFMTSTRFEMPMFRKQDGCTDQHGFSITSFPLRRCELSIALKHDPSPSGLAGAEDWLFLNQGQITGLTVS